MIHVSERDTPEAAERRAHWRAETQTVPAERLVFVDETGTTVNMTSRYGRAPKGVRVHGAVPGGCWQTTTLLGAMSLQGVRASMTVGSATDTDVFLSFVRRVLVPVLRPGAAECPSTYTPSIGPSHCRSFAASHRCRCPRLVPPLRLLCHTYLNTAVALAGGGSFTATKISSHASTNMEVISTFLPVCFEVTKQDSYSHVKLVPKTESDVALDSIGRWQ
jgi:hypothetical protein